MLKKTKLFVLLWSGLSAGLATLAVKADTPYTGTGQILGTPVAGLVFTNGAGQILVRGQVQTLRVDSTDPRLTTRRTVLGDGFYQADGSVWVYGAAYLEVGSWAGINFTPAGGIWEVNWQGVMRPDASLELSLAGYGSGGAIDGLRMEETLTRGPDPAAPTQQAGVIKPVPVNTAEIVDNFDDNEVTGWTYDDEEIKYTLVETNQQFTVRASVPWNSGLYGGWVIPSVRHNWSVATNSTLEARVDLVSMSENATNYSGLVLWSDTVKHSYILSKGVDFVEVAKWANGGVAVFLHEKAVIKNTNVVLSLALTRVDPNLVLTARVLDKDNREAVLFQGSVVDTPKVDPTLTSAEIEALSGRKGTVSPDSGPPVTSGNAILMSAVQYTDGKQPEMEVTYDNFELRASEIPPVTIERAVRLIWPASTTIYTPQGAPTVQGPWLPIQDKTIPGLNQMTVPANEITRFFRLQ
ncbi:MAG: hypothetical protein AB9869_32030 [Verrucomicrobiia bacterium]